MARFTFQCREASNDDYSNDNWAFPNGQAKLFFTCYVNLAPNSIPFSMQKQFQSHFSRKDPGISISIYMANLARIRQPIL